VNGDTGSVFCWSDIVMDNTHFNSLSAIEYNILLALIVYTKIAMYVYIRLIYCQYIILNTCNMKLRMSKINIRVKIRDGGYHYVKSFSCFPKWM
jgi:hypothetical protein